jgi:hypothetical protein
LLHYAAIGWGGARLAAPVARAEKAPAPILAELRGAPVPPPAAEPGAAVPLPQVQLHSSQARARAPGPLLPRYRVSLPPPAELRFDVARLDASGAAASGRMLMDWRSDGARYRLTMATVVDGGALLELASEGALAAAGIVPRTLSAQRRGKARTATHFDAHGGSITFSASEERIAMAPGTQDKATWPLQLAGIGRADARQLKAGLDLMVGEEKGASLCRFALVGQEEIETGIGRLATWHLSYQPAPGSYRTRLDVWLAAGRAWYPVQLRSSEAGGTTTTQTIREIVVKEAGI